jgi:DNA-binding ferritin-like protein
VKEFLILRLRNAAIACDQRKDHALAELLTEAIHELEKHDERKPQTESAER